jgi:surface carbohydrate biosynthesis protein
VHLVNKVLTFYATFLRPPKEWQLPNKADLLIYDAEGMEALFPFVKNYKFGIMSIRGESINLPCLFRASVNPAFWMGDSLRVYMDAYISIVAPKVILTFIDNDFRFYEISNRFPDIKTIFVQNGRRAELRDVFGQISSNINYHVDYMLVFGEAVGKEYLKFITGRAIPIGSLKNNSVPISKEFTKDTVLFISTWETEPDRLQPFVIKKNGEPIDWKEYFSAEKPILEFLDIWCAQRKKTLMICGRTTEAASDEISFYQKYLQKCKWVYLPRGEIYATYHYIDSAEIVVFIDSTCGYESLSRGKRTAALTCRGAVTSESTERFGWPAKLPNEGPFWISEIDESGLHRVMDFLITSSDTEWELTREKIAQQVMVLDPQNSTLVALLNELLPEPETTHKL